MTTPATRLQRAVERQQRLQRMAVDLGVLLREARQEVLTARDELLAAEDRERQQQLQESGR